MKKRLLIIFILMSLCVAGITALQLYYSYENYRFAERVFNREANEALAEAKDSSMIAHNRSVEDKFRKWMNDTTFIRLSSRWDARQNTTLFTIKEQKPYRGSGQIEISLSVEDMADKLDSLTPRKRQLFIEHMVNTVDDGLKKGTVWFFTQGLGDSLSQAYYKTPVEMKIINREYKKALARREIDLPFSFEKGPDSNGFCTHEVNMGVDKPRWMKACFAGVDVFLLGKLKWVIAGSLLLIIITLACFWYTVRTLLSQHKLSRIKDDFISNMTHEIHTPLASLRVTAEALKKFSHDEASRESYIDIILHQGARLSALTDEILTGARLDKKGILPEDSIDANEWIESVHGENDYENVIFEPSAERVRFIGNRFHLGNAIRNLLDNAVKYNTNADPEIRVTVTVSGKKLIITIADNGPGIPDKEKDKVFGEFYRISSGNRHDVKGYGLGLSYVKKVMEAHKGSVSVKDNQPAGAVFVIKLPL